MAWPLVRQCCCTKTSQNGYQLSYSGRFQLEFHSCRWPFLFGQFVIDAFQKTYHMKSQFPVSVAFAWPNNEFSSGTSCHRSHQGYQPRKICFYSGSAQYFECGCRNCDFTVPHLACDPSLWTSECDELFSRTGGGHAVPVLKQSCQLWV